MQLSLSQNIARLRRERDLTQERLAELLGVSCAAVSKWERGAATPELGLIAEMAALFAVSMDALVGYEFQSHDKGRVVEWLKRCFHSRDHEDVFPDVEKALQRYPNCFDVVYYSAHLYHIRGFYQSRTDYSRRALTLYRHASLLIGQNTDPEISEISIGNEMADIYLLLGDADKALELLKRYNPCQLNHAQIGYTLASVCNDAAGALPWLSGALLDLTVTHMRVVMGFINVFYKTGDYANALAVADWALAFYPGLRDGETRSYLDKTESSLRAVRAGLLLELGRSAEAAESLRRAKELALYFDEAPSYDARMVRFVSTKKPATAFDSMGDTAMLGLEDVMKQLGKPELHELWRAVRDEA